MRADSWKICKKKSIILGNKAARLSLLTYIMRGNWMHDVNLFAVCAVAVSVTIAFVFLSLSGSLVRQLCAVLDRKLETILRLSYNLIQYLTVFVLLYQIFNYLGFPIPIT